MIYDLTPDEETTKLVLTDEGIQIWQNLGGGAFIPLSAKRLDLNGSDVNAKNDQDKKEIIG